VFGSLSDGKVRHRAAERISKLNKLARPYGVRLEIEASSGRLLISHRAARQLRRFHSKLLQSSGATQRTVAHELGKRISADPSCHSDSLDEFTKLQLAEMPAWTGKPLQFALGLSLDALFIDPPYSPHDARGERGPARPGACAFLQSALTQPKVYHGFLLGEPGGGKTAALYRVFQELSRLYLAGNIAELPILIPADHAEICAGRLSWRLGGLDAYLRARPEIDEAIRVLESSGKAVFLLDAVDENPALVDFSRTEVVKAWQTVLKNRCLVSSRSRFFSSHLQDGRLVGKSGGDWSVISLADWSPPQAKTFYRRLADCPIAPPREARVSATKIKDAFVHLGNIFDRKAAAGTAPVRSTPLNLWLHSLFVASNRGLLPRNEYELLEFATRTLCQWQAAKKGRVTPLEAMMGLLARASWNSYSAGPGRERRYAQYGDLTGLLEAQCPTLIPRRADVIVELENHPLIHADPAHGLLWIDPHFSNFLAARHLVQTLRISDVARAIEQFSQPVLWDVSRFFDEAVDCLDEAARAAVAAALIDSFRSCERAYAEEKKFPRAWALNQLGYHLGRMNHPAARGFLHRVLDENSLALNSEMCRWAIVIGLALSGDAAALGPYVDRLEKKPARFRLSMAYCQVYFLDKNAEGGDFEDALKRPSPQWAKSCDAILAQLASKTFKSIRLLDLFALRRFLEELGPAPFLSKTGQGRTRALYAVLSQLAPECASDRRLAAQVRLLRQTLDKIKF
jgi:hypothetical protein